MQWNQKFQNFLTLQLLSSLVTAFLCKQSCQAIIYRDLRITGWVKSKLKKAISWKYLHDDIYHRAHDYVYLKKFKFQSSIYLTIYSDNYQDIYV